MKWKVEVKLEIKMAQAQAQKIMPSLSFFNKINK
jgi:hypothetical protein